MNGIFQDENCGIPGTPFPGTTLLGKPSELASARKPLGNLTNSRLNSSTKPSKPYVEVPATRKTLSSIHQPAQGLTQLAPAGRPAASQTGYGETAQTTRLDELAVNPPERPAGMCWAQQELEGNMRNDKELEERLRAAAVVLGRARLVPLQTKAASSIQAEDLYTAELPPSPLRPAENQLGDFEVLDAAELVWTLPDAAFLCEDDDVELH
ncbi:hypothetical protein ACKKBF_B12225 [Auxenochlorella protothecoides x Auxenochlorella symbiontica]